MQKQQYPITIETPFGPYTVSGEPHVCANGDTAEQFVVDGVIYKHIKRHSSSDLPDEIWHQHGQLPGVPSTMNFWIVVSKHGTDKQDEVIREIAVYTILKRYKQWAADDLAAQKEQNDRH